MINQTNQYTKESLTKALCLTLNSAYGSGWFERLLATDKLKLISSDEARLIGGEKSSAAQGVYDQNNDIIFLIYNNIDFETDLKQLLLHEIGVHALKLGKSDDEFAVILKCLSDLKGCNEKIKEAVLRIPEGTHPAHAKEEMAAYLCCDSASLSVPRRIVSSIKGWLRKITSVFPVFKQFRCMIWANRIDEIDFICMVNEVLKHAPDMLSFNKRKRPYARSMNPEGCSLLYSFAGQNAETADKDMLALAQQMLDANEDAEIVRQQTGWHKGIDGKMRFEISDHNAKLDDSFWYEEPGEVDGYPIRKMSGYLSDFYVKYGEMAEKRLGRPGGIEKGMLIHPELLSAYPELAGIQVELLESDGYFFAKKGHLVPGKNKKIYMEVSPLQGGDSLAAIMHEVQHAIQLIEKFAEGGSIHIYEDKYKDTLVRGGADYISWGTALRNGKDINELQEEVEALGWDRPDTAFLEWLRDVADLTQYETGAKVQRALMVGGSTRVYEVLAGEVEARNSEARLYLSADERRMTPICATADTQDSDVILLDVEDEALEGLSF